jgi:hypothetical protein
MMKKRFAYLLGLSFGFFSCNEEDGLATPESATAPVQAKIACEGSCDDLSQAGYQFICITPSDIGTGINPDYNWPHVTAAPVAEANNFLLLFLPGTNMNPNACSKFYKQASDSGYHVIALSYVCATTVTDPCLNVNSGSLKLYSKEVLEGINYSTMTEVDANNSINTRLTNLLTHLKTTYPGEGWDQFLKSNGTIAWNKIVLSGRSLGGMHAAMISSFRKTVKRVICFSSPREVCTGINSTWPSLSLGKFYCFTHTQDAYSKQLTVWSAMGFTEAPTNVDLTLPPYGNAHLLTTAQTTTQAHKCTTVNCDLPAAGWAEVWGYLLKL